MSSSLVDKWVSDRRPHKNQIIEMLRHKPMKYSQLYKALPDIPKPSIRRNMGELKFRDVVVQTGDKRWFLVTKDEI